jgi:hypothetical protein
MPYTNPDIMEEVANILEDFDEESLKDLFKSQIESDDCYTALPVNHFQPLYVSIQRLLKMDGADEDDVAVIKSRYNSICKYIIGLLCDKFNITIDEEWLNDNAGNIPAIAMTLYQFFVLDIFQNIFNFLRNYVDKNVGELAKIFSESAQNKDVSTVTNAKVLQAEYAVIASCIYDITDYIFSMLDSEVIFDYIEPGYIPGEILERMYNDNNLTGDFVAMLAAAYKDNLSLRSKIAFELIYTLRAKTPFDFINKDKIQDPDSSN